MTVVGEALGVPVDDVLPRMIRFTLDQRGLERGLTWVTTLPMHNTGLDV